ncbi:MAG TPA: SDR family NAD(P)-dependent oxidoreductase [Terriglobales bacterium]|nr:SDR family NAD(P)-dependent oxidoreductase [Terriglobales bacterium]
MPGEWNRTVPLLRSAAHNARPDEASKTIHEIANRFGRIDLLAHLVGGFAGGKTVAELDDATFQNMLAMNLNSAFYVLRATIPHMRRAGAGRIVTIASRAAESPGAGVGAYSASKAALVSLTRTVAVENKDAGITANVILPGTMDTPLNRKFMPDADFNSWVRPSSVAALIVWLGSEAARDLTGAAIPVYGKGL